MLLKSHQYIKEFKHVYELFNYYPYKLDTNIHLRVLPGQDQQWYNLPTSDKVAVILPGDGIAPEQHNIIFCPCSGQWSLT